MNDATVRRWAGSFGVAGFAVFLIALPLYYLAGPESRIEDTAATTAFVTTASTFNRSKQGCFAHDQGDARGEFAINCEQRTCSGGDRLEVLHSDFHILEGRSVKCLVGNTYEHAKTT